MDAVPDAAIARPPLSPPASMLAQARDVRDALDPELTFRGYLLRTAGRYREYEMERWAGCRAGWLGERLVLVDGSGRYSGPGVVG